jgi:predicted MFS family arabinose efflux permease
MNLSPFKLMCAAGLFAIFSSTLSKSPVLPLFEVHLGATASEVGIIAAVSTTLLGRFMAPLTGGAVLGYLGSGDNLGFAAIYSVCLMGGALALLIFAKMPTAVGNPQTPKTWKDQREGLIQLVSSGPLLAIGMVEAAVLFMYGTIEVFLPLYGISHGIGAFAIGVCLAAQVITLSATKPVMGRLSDRHGRSGQIVWGALLGVAEAACMAASANFVLLLALSSLIGLSLSIVTSATSAAVADIRRCEMRGSAMGVFGTIVDIGHSAGPLVSGMVVVFWGFKAAFMGSAIILALAVVSFRAITTNQLNTCSISEQG